MRHSLSTLVAPPMVKTVEPSSSKNVATRQAPYGGGIRQALRQPTVPQLHGSLRPVVETFVVAVDEQHGIGARLQPSDVGTLLGREIPRKAKVAGNDEIVVTRQAFPKIPIAQLLHVSAAMDVARHIDRHRITASLL